VHADNASEQQPTNNALPLSTSQRHTGEAVELYSFLTSALDGGGQLHILTTLLLGTKTNTHRIRKAAWALEPVWAFGDEKSFALPTLEHQVIHPSTSHYISYTNLALR
jgi:hypothetical protein